MPIDAITPKLELFYTISNCGDGSASVSFHEDREAAQIACDIEDEYGEAFCENWPYAKELRFDAAGKFITPSETKEELRRQLAEIRGEKADDISGQDGGPESSAVFDGATTKVKLYYTIYNGGDGSAAVSFHEDAEAAQIACDIEDEYGEPFSENYVYLSALEFDARGKLLNPGETKEELRKVLKEIRGETEEPERSKPPVSPAPRRPSGPRPGF